MDWTSGYTDFLSQKTQQPPGPINNNGLFADQTLILNSYRENMKQDEDFVLLNLNTWTFIHSLYGGGPEVKYNDYLKDIHEFDASKDNESSNNVL